MASAAPNSPEILMAIVYDNNRGTKGLRSSWGFSCLIQGTPQTILFDTGEHGDLVLENMEQLGLDPKQIDAIVLSHNHWDHTGGIEDVLKVHSEIPVYLPSGFPAEFRDRVRALKAEPIVAAEATKLCPGVKTTGTLGAGALEEHGLCVRTGKGWVLITGCAHPGVDNLAARAREVAGESLHLVVGGFHMRDWPTERIDAVIDHFEQQGVERSAPCHCSGDDTRARFKERLAERCSLVGVGDVFRFPSLGPSR